MNFQLQQLKRERERIILDAQGSIRAEQKDPGAFLIFFFCFISSFSFSYTYSSWLREREREGSSPFRKYAGSQALHKLVMTRERDSLIFIFFIFFSFFFFFLYLSSFLSMPSFCLVRALQALLLCDRIDLGHLSVVPLSCPQCTYIYLPYTSPRDSA